VIALGRLGWSLRKIEAAIEVRRETAGGYLRSGGITILTPRGWGVRLQQEQTVRFSTGCAGPKPTNEIITGFLPEVRFV